MSYLRNDPLENKTFYVKLREKKSRFCKQLLRAIFLYNICVYFIYQYSFVRNCRWESNCKFWGKKPQVHLIIARELPNPPPRFKKS